MVTAIISSLLAFLTGPDRAEGPRGIPWPSGVRGEQLCTGVCRLLPPSPCILKEGYFLITRVKKLFFLKKKPSLYFIHDFSKGKQSGSQGSHVETLAASSRPLHTATRPSLLPRLNGQHRCKETHQSPHTLTAGKGNKRPLPCRGSQVAKLGPSGLGTEARIGPKGFPLARLSSTLHCPPPAPFAPCPCPESLCCADALCSSGCLDCAVRVSENRQQGAHQLNWVAI